MSRNIELPCTVGDTVYAIQRDRKQVLTYTIISVYFDKSGMQFGWEANNKGRYRNMQGFTDKDIGKTVFFTQEEAREALRREHV